MKRFLLLSTLLALASCSKPAEEPQTITPELSHKQVSLHYDQSQKLTANTYVEWSSENDFVASVSHNGQVAGGHVGKTNIVGTTTSGEQIKCEVSVEPYITEYREPILEFGITAKELIARETRELVSQSESMIEYKGDNAGIGYIRYNFTQGKLSSAAMEINIYNAVPADKFIAERYHTLSINVNLTVLINALTEEQATMMILSDKDIMETTVTYQPMN